jgi:RNA polymerase sigma-70 factor (family 1)
MVTMPHDNDCKALFEAIAAGDSVAFESFFTSYRSRIYGVALKWTKSSFAAEEITQDLFISIWTGRAHLGEVKDPMAYLYSSVYHKISRYLKKEATQLSILRMRTWSANEFSNDTEERVYANEGQRFMNQAIAKLSPQKKLIYELSRQEGKSYHEIAERLNLSPHTVKSHLLKAIKLIRNYMKNNALSLALFLAALLLGKK